MAPQRTDDILDLLDEIHGDGITRREAAVDSAVGNIEGDAYRAYNGLRDLTQKGTKIPPSAAPAAVATPAQTPQQEAVLANPPANAAETNMQQTPSLPAEAKTPVPLEPVDVISGDGAEFRERGHTQTQIIRRPKKWFGRK